MKDIIELLSKPTTIGVISLAIIGLIYLIKEFVLFLQNNILPAAYKWHLEKKRIILPFAKKVLDKDWREASFFRDGNPKYVDFQEGYIFVRHEINRINDTLKRGRFVHIEGQPSTGKSVIGYTIAYQSMLKKRTVIYFDRPSSIPAGFIEFLSHPFASNLDKSKVLLILDDAHLDIGLACRLFSFVYNQFSEMKLLFISRPIIVEHIKEEEESLQFLFTQYMPKIEIVADSAIFPLMDFFSLKRFNRKISSRISNVFYHECASDLLLLGRYLKEWNGSSTVDIEQLRKSVINSICSDLELMRNVSKDAIQLYLIIGIFYGFEVPVDRKYLSNLNFDIDPMIKAGSIRLQNGFVSLFHSSLAKLYSNAIKKSKMPEFDELSNRFHPFPLDLFKDYIRHGSRNICELLIGLRKAPDVLRKIINDQTLHKFIRKAIEQEEDMNTLGWALLILYINDKKVSWTILEKTNLSINSLDKLKSSDPYQISLFIFNLSKVSIVKAREWLLSIPQQDLAEVISSLELVLLVQAMMRIKKFSAEYFEKLLSTLNLNIMIDKLLEEDTEKLIYSLNILGLLLKGRMDVRSTSIVDFSGEWVTKVSFYFERSRATRFLPGRRLKIPYSSSSSQKWRYLEWLYENRKRGSGVTIDIGAEKATKLPVKSF